MELLKRRPIAVISVISIILMYLSSKIGGITGCILLTLVPAVIAIAIIFFLNKKNVKGMLKRIIYVIIFVAVSLTLSLRAFDFFNINHSMIKERISKECIISGEVTDIGYRSEFSERLYVNISSIDGERTDINAVLEIEGESHLYYGDVFTLKAKPEFFDEKEKYLIADGYAFKIICEDIEGIEFLDNIADERITFFRDINEDIQDMIYRLTDEESGAFLSAIILGNRDLLEDNVIRDFRRCGISHILALSGLHVTVIIGFFDLVLRKMYVGKRIRCFILSFLGLAYLAITGFSMSASRAVIMLCMVYLSHLLHEDSDSITSLAIASVVILAINPYALVSVSLWMSVIATLGIIIISEIISPLGYMINKKSFVVRIGYRLLTTASLTLAAIFFVSVFNWLCFGEISIVAPLTNLIITPLVTIVLVMGLTILVFSFLAPIATFLGTVVCFLTEITLKLSEYFSSWHNITVSLEYDFVKYIAVPFIIAIIIFLLVRIKHKWTIAVIPGAAVIAFIICFNIHSIGMQDMAKISYIQNGSSEMLLITDGESVTVCDISTGGYKHLLLAYETAEQKGSTEIDNVILTHYHNYHSKAGDRWAPG